MSAVAMEQSGLSQTLRAQDRTESQYSRAARHSRRVRIMKFALPVLALVIGGGFVAASWVRSPAKLDFDLSSTAIRDGKLVMADPKLQGFTSENQPYSMNAAQAVQDVGNTSIIQLENIDAHLPVSDGSIATIDASHAIYDRLKNTIELANPMTLSTSDGKSASFQSANIDMAKGTLTTEQPVEISIDGASINAGSLSVSGHGKVFLFDGRVRMELDPARLNAERADERAGNTTDE